jgi:serine protease Do
MFSSVAAQLKPSVVSLSTERIEKVHAPQYEFFFGDPFGEFFDEFFGGTPQRKQQRKPGSERYYERRIPSLGSGVIIDETGYVLTNNHVVAGADKIKVKLWDEKEYDGKVIGQDPKTDLAVVKISAKRKFPGAQLGDSDKVKIGQWVIAIGSPFGLSQTVTAGIVSAERQSLQVEGKVYRDFIQTDAAINRGNSGGPLVNLRGEVVGINTAIFAPTGVFAGIGFAIPINQAKAILSDLIEKGKVVRGWLGVEIKQVDDVIAKQYGLSEPQGALVNNVFDGSPAEKAGLKRGDLIVKVDERKVKDIANLQDIISSKAPGKKVKLQIIRNGEPKTVTVGLGEMPGEVTSAATVEKPETVSWLGAEFSDATSEVRQQFGLASDVKGCVVVSIEPGSDAQQAGLAPGDVIREINRKGTPDIAEFNKVVKKVNLKEGVMFDVLRDGSSLYITYQKM